MRQLSFKRHRFLPDIIRHAIWLYARFTLSLCDVEEMLAERGQDVSYETIRRWFLKFGSVIVPSICSICPNDRGFSKELAVRVRIARID
jgi:transposase-like protein